MKKIEKIKVAVDATLYYFTIFSVLNFLSLSLSYLLFRSSEELIGQLKSSKFEYVVLIMVILFLSVLSKVLKRKLQEGISLDSKGLIYIIVGLLLIITAVISIPSYAALIRFYLDHIASIDKGLSQGKKDILMNGIYFYVVYIVIYALQIVIGACFTFITIRQDKQIEETHSV